MDDKPRVNHWDDFAGIDLPHRQSSRIVMIENHNIRSWSLRHYRAAHIIIKVMGGKAEETFAVGSAVMVEQPLFVTGVFGIGVNVGAGEAVGVAIGDDGAQEVRRRKDKSKKIRAMGFLVCTRSPFSCVIANGASKPSPTIKENCFLKTGNGIASIVPLLSSIRQMKSSTQFG